jgi:hypothetical protein
MTCTVSSAVKKPLPRRTPKLSLISILELERHEEPGASSSGFSRNAVPYWVAVGLLLSLRLAAVATAQQAPGAQIQVRMSWGYTLPNQQPFYVQLLPTRGLEISNARGTSLEPGEGLKDGAWQSKAGGGDIDGVNFTVSYPQAPPERRQNVEMLWSYLIAQSAADAALRLTEDAGLWINPPRFTVQMNPEETKGFTVAVEQLLQHRALWVPALDVYLTTSRDPISFNDDQATLSRWRGKRILQRVRSEPEATYKEFASRWADTGNPNYEHPRLPKPGHIVCLTWDSAIPKFGIDRRAGVWNDYGNPDRFRFWYSFGSIGEGLRELWKNQSLAYGLPVITTVFEKEGVRYTVEQFAYPLNGPPPERRGNIPMVLLQKVTTTNLGETPQAVSISMNHERTLPPYSENRIIAEDQNGATIFEGAGRHQVLFAIQGLKQRIGWSGVATDHPDELRVEATVFLKLPPRGSRAFVVKLPSPFVAPADLETLLNLNYDSARSATLNFWSGMIAKGAQFRVPEKAVNELFRASLWHALMLPRRHGGEGKNVQIDLPYSNFAYQQTGTPWPINQAVYVDYMLYGLRGYPAIATEELRAIYRNNQEFSGHVGGNANWGAYTPGMVYAVAQNYLLSQNRQELDEVLPYSLKALDWCLDQMQSARDVTGFSQGLFEAPLNDGAGNGIWAFNQAYMYAGLRAFGKVLRMIGNPRGQQALTAARNLRGAIARGFGHVSMLSPLVQLRDHTWAPYVPSNALIPRRLWEQWYPADADTGAVHLLRLKALPASGRLADDLLNDQEDNLYFKGWGMTDEPVYDPQATAYLLRDDPKAVIRDFYSMMASAFSHTVFEPLEHRWAHQEYFGPPSTDGSWFNIYRHMLINEFSDSTLILAEATPRRWLAAGDKIEVDRAPTGYGLLSFTLQSKPKSNTIRATVTMPDGSRPRTLLVRFRQPEDKPIRSVMVNGNAWHDFDISQEWVRITRPGQPRYVIVVQY